MMHKGILTLHDVDINNKRVLIREDFNVPIADGRVQNDIRIRSALPGIKQALAAGASVQLMSHLGRPEAGKWEAKYSLQPVAICLQNLLQVPVNFVKQGFATTVESNTVTLYENVRFLPGETDNSQQLAQQMAALCDVFVMDAFGSAHRAHASTVGVAQYAPVAVAGPLLAQEIDALDRIMRAPQHPVVAIIGGAKVSSKIDVLLSLIDIVDCLLIGGGMANTLLAAQGYNVGASLFEPDLIPEAQRILLSALQKRCQILLPTDVVVDSGIIKNIKEVMPVEKIMDIGTQTINEYSKEISLAKTVLWNGPMGVFEDPRYAIGTQQMATAVAHSSAYSVVGGGETLTAIEQFKVTNSISYISTGGGAFLEYIEGKSLPAISILQQNREQYARN